MEISKKKFVPFRHIGVLSKNEERITHILITVHLSKNFHYWHLLDS